MYELMTAIYLQRARDRAEHKKALESASQELRSELDEYLRGWDE